MIIKPAESTDRDQAFEYICKIWTYNTYEKEPTLKVYDEVLNDPTSFAFFLMDEEGGYHGFCHGVYFNTFWMTGMTCYVSSIYTNEEDRGNHQKSDDRCEDPETEVLGRHSLQPDRTDGHGTGVQGALGPGLRPGGPAGQNRLS